MQHQSYAYGHNHFDIDRDLQAILTRYWPDWTDRRERLTDIGILSGTEVYDVTWHVDQDAPPVLVNHDINGERVDRARLSPAHLATLRKCASVNRAPYEGGSWHDHFTQLHLVGDSGLACVLCITNQTVYAIHKYAPEFADAWVERLLSGEAWGATWMTEVQGGTDLGANEVTATEDGDVWRLNGEKYFCSGAGLTDIAIVTAKIPGADSGAKGISLFLVPRINSDGELNYRVNRFKEKSATRSVPSGEVTLDNTEAWLIGEADEGIYYTLENFMVSRLANAVGSASMIRKAQMEVLGRVRARKVFGTALIDHPLIRRDLTELQLRGVGSMVLAQKAVSLFDAAWHERPPYDDPYHHARFWAHLAKARCAEHTAIATQQAQEIFGGIGFVEDFPISRLHREALVLPIWEGPGNVQALDLMEAMVRKQAHVPFLAEVHAMLDAAGTETAATVKARLDEAFAAIAGYDAVGAQWHGKQFVRTIADVAQIALMYDLASSGGDVYGRMAEAYAERFLGSGEVPQDAYADDELWAWDGGAVTGLAQLHNTSGTTDTSLPHASA